MPLTIQITQRAILSGIPSASGLTILDSILYLTGDDSPFLFALKDDLELLKKYPLFEPEQIENGRIPKKVKPDFESSTLLEINNYPHILILGSGSKSPHRDTGYLIKLPTRYNRNPVIRPVPVKPLYDLLRMNETDKLNIEASATTDQHVLLFHRRNSNSGNKLLFFEKEEFIEFVQGHLEGVPFPKIFNFTLPQIKGIEAGFSGADFFDGKLFFSASVEDTENAIDDGDILGSFIGIMEIPEMYTMKGAEPGKPSLKACTAVYENGELFPGKIESVCVIEKFSENHYRAVAVTDNDDGASELVMLEIILNI